MDIKTVGVVGAGTMGNGIAHVFAKSGYSVVLLDVEQRFVDRGMDTIRKNLEREVSKGKLSAEQRDQAVSGIKGVTERSALGAWTSLLRQRASASRSRLSCSAIWRHSAGLRSS